MKQDSKKNKEIREIISSLPDEIQGHFQELFKAARKYSGDDYLAQEEFIRSVTVGNCPTCESTRTKDCDDSPLNDITIGLCLECFHMWCLECGEKFKLGQTVCTHWE